MNRKQKIIVSITGIFIVLLALVGLTYAYFLTRIRGNEKDKSISVTTANLELTYGDGNGVLLPAGLIEPSDENIKFYVSNEETDDPTDVLLDGNNPIVKDNKTFTVTNNGEDSSYVVIIDEAETKYASNGSYTNEDNQEITYNKGDVTEFLSNDFRYTLICTVKDNQGNVLSDEKCNGAETKSVFPINGGILVGNAIEKERVHEYTLTMWYIETGKNQSNDMNKTYQARVNIADVAQMENPFKTGVAATDNASLAYNIINNAKENKNGTKLLNTPLTKVAEEISNKKGTGKMVEQELDLSGKQWYYGSTYVDAQPWNGGSPLGSGITTCSSTIEKKYISYPTVGESWYVKSCKSETIAVVETEEMEYESSIQTVQDDLGTSYYFRGNVEDNYVNFAGMCWRIVRIAGDGSTKLILEDQYTTCDDIEDTDGEGTTDYAYTGNWKIGAGNYGYELKNVDSDSSNEYIMNYLNPVTNNTSSMVKAFYDFQITKLADYTGKLKSGDWCLGDKAYTRSGSSGSYAYTLLEEYNYSSSMYYDAYTRLTSGNANGYQPTLKCNGTILNEFADVSGVSSKAPMYVSAITTDEIVYAGSKYGENNRNYYLINNYQKSNNFYFWSLSPSHNRSADDRAFVVDFHGVLSDLNVYNDDLAFRPSVSLASSAVISEGEGTLEKPYKIR